MKDLVLLQFLAFLAISVDAITICISTKEQNPTMFEENGYKKDQRKIQTLIYSAENPCRLRLVAMNLEKKHYLEAMDDALYVLGSSMTIKQSNTKKAEYLLSLCYYNLDLLIKAERHINAET